MNNQELEQMRFLQTQLESMKQESTHTDEQITTMNHQCKGYQNQMDVSYYCFFNYFS